MSFSASVGRHGFLRALRRSLLERARRLVEFEICRVEINSGEPYGWPDVAGYETRLVAEAEFHERLDPEFGQVDYRWAFARGDVCSASFCGEKLVGYSFYSSLPTRVRDGVAFEFPSDRYVYAFASATAPSHRGKRLEQDRWKTTRKQRIAATGMDPRIVWYVNIANLESRATSKAVRATNELIGHIVYLKVFGRYRFFSSPGCRRAATRFAPAPERRNRTAT